MGVERILQRARELGFAPDVIEFLGPDYWDRLCTTHASLVRDRFDYRVSAADKGKLEATEKASKMKRAGDHLTTAELSRYTKLSIMLRNNLTELELEVGMSLDLTVDELIDLLLGLLNFSRDWVNFRDLNASASPEMTLARNGQKMARRATLREAGYKAEDALEIVIDFALRDELTPAGIDEQDAYSMLGLNIGRTPSGAGFTTRVEVLRCRATELAQNMLWTGGRDILALAEAEREDEAA